MWYLDLAGGSNIFYVHPYLDLDVQFDEYFSNGWFETTNQGCIWAGKKDSIHTQEFEKVPDDLFVDIYKKEGRTIALKKHVFCDVGYTGLDGFLEHVC